MRAHRAADRQIAGGTRTPTQTGGASAVSGLAMALLAVIALAVAGCASPGSAVADPGGSSATDRTSGGGADQLAGRTFLSTAVQGHDLVAGSTIRLTFDASHVTANAGCNTLSGSYRLADGAITVRDMGGTEMGCDQALMDQDSWLADLLGSGLDSELHDDVLTLTGQGVTMRLTDRRVVDPDRPLQGITWRLDGIMTGTGPSGSVSSVPRGITATLRIADGRIHFFDGLNDYDGPIDPGGRLVIGPDAVQISGEIAGSAVGCASGSACSVDMSLLTDDFDYRIDADRLTVTGTGRYADRGLIFVAGDASASPAEAASDTTGAPGSTGSTGAPGSTGDSGGSVSPARPAPGTPRSAPGLTSAANPGKSLPGPHDSIPPQPSPRGAPTSVDGSDAPSGSGAHPLPGHTFRLTGLFTDAGGADTRFRDARFTIEFDRSSATAVSSCGTITYPTVRYYRTETTAMVDLGDPSGPDCSLGTDPAGVPSGQLMAVTTDGGLFLSTGFVGWWFEPVG